MSVEHFTVKTSNKIVFLLIVTNDILCCRHTLWKYEIAIIVSVSIDQSDARRAGRLCAAHRDRSYRFCHGFRVIMILLSCHYQDLRCFSTPSFASARPDRVPRPVVKVSLFGLTFSVCIVLSGRYSYGYYIFFFFFFSSQSITNKTSSVIQVWKMFVIFVLFSIVAWFFFYFSVWTSSRPTKVLLSNRARNFTIKAAFSCSISNPVGVSRTGNFFHLIVRINRLQIFNK